MWVEIWCNVFYSSLSQTLFHLVDVEVGLTLNIAINIKFTFMSEKYFERCFLYSRMDRVVVGIDQLREYVDILLSLISFHII